MPSGTASRFMDSLRTSFGKPSLRNLSLFILCFISAFAVRSCHFNRESTAVGKIIAGDSGKDSARFIPFTIESAMMYSYIEDIASGKGVPAVDKGLAGLEDIAPWRQMNMGLEWFIGWGYRIKCLFSAPPHFTKAQTIYQDNPDLAQWASFQLRLWASLTSGFIFLWLATLRCPWMLALFGGLLHAVAASAVARSTGQDIVRGEFCIPLIVASILLAQSICLKPSRLKLILLFASTFIAFATWDLCQMLFSSWAIYEILRIAIGGAPTVKRRSAWTVIYMAMALNALLVPFNQTYGLIMSPLMLVLMPSLMAMLIFGSGGTMKRLALAIAVPLCLYVFWTDFINNPQYASNYSHFTEVMRAKIKFDNVKPQDPNLLTYDARIMWTPSMHSATWNIAASFFPSLGSVIPLRLPLNALNFAWNFIPITLAAFPAMLLLGTLSTRIRRSILRGLPRSLMPFIFTAGFIVGFIYIVRYHEFLIIFLAVSLPLLLHDFIRGLRGMKSPRSLRIAKAILWLVPAFLLLFEACTSLLARERRYSGDIYMRDTAKLIEWFRRFDVKGDVCITDFTIGPMLKAYCGASIAMQPQFGLERIRRPSELFYNVMYHGSERDLNEFCKKYKASFVIYDRGYVAPLHIYSPRYFAAAIRLKDSSPASMMYYCPDALKWFYRLTPPKDLSSLSLKFTVFKVIYPQDRVAAMKLCAEGDAALNAGDTPYAQRCTRVAVWLDPASEQARILFFKAFSRLPVLTLDAVH